MSPTPSDKTAIPPVGHPHRRLAVRAAARQRLATVIRAWSPSSEPCGWLLGDRENRRDCIRDVTALQNAGDSPGPLRFALGAVETHAADRFARTQDMRVIGFWHAHPTGELVPSASDKRGHRDQARVGLAGGPVLVALVDQERPTRVTFWSVDVRGSWSRCEPEAPPPPE